MRIMGSFKTGIVKLTAIPLVLLALGLASGVPAQAGSIPDMVLIPPGWSEMGSLDGRADERPVRRVWLDGYHMDRFEVTNKQFAYYLNKRSSKPPNEHWRNMAKVSQCGIMLKGWDFYAKPGMENMPVVFVTWRDAFDYCRFAHKELPSEAQWERACRLGSRSQPPPPPGLLSLERGQNIHRWWKPHPDPVGSHAPDDLGLYDMLGNVAEYTEDVYLADWYGQMPEYNPIYLKAPDQKPKRYAPGVSRAYFKILRRVARGGSFSTNPANARCSSRSFRNQIQADMNSFTGFRCSLRMKRGQK